jgi:hypothetical protein
MPPEPAEHRGSQPIAAFLVQTHLGQDLKFLPTRANGQRLDQGRGLRADDMGA